jgi:signal transduction histidine kinase
MNQQAAMGPELQALAVHMSQRREQILRAWHTALDADPELTSFSKLSRTQFNDHIPAVLDAFEHRLRAVGTPGNAIGRAQQNASAAEHGLHRWQQGYDQRQTMREWAHLQLCLLQEFEDYALSHPDVDPRVMVLARRELARLCSEGIIESTTRYARLQQSEAAGRVRDLEQAFEDLQTLERERAEGWRQAAHDIRGSVGIISNASAILSRQVTEPMRMRFSRMLERGVSSLHTMLSELIDVARLEAGQERRHIAPFDAARTLRGFCDTMRDLAADSSLFLLAQGPDSLPVQGDEAKVLRIAQNLVLNALQATEQGGVRIFWEGLEQHWRLCVQDTGPGMTRGAAAPLERALIAATEESHEVERHPEPAPTLPSQSEHRPSPELAGEGIGLSIVKRLCELLDAALELETAPGAGTTFRVTFPRHYPDAPPEAGGR